MPTPPTDGTTAADPTDATDPTLDGEAAPSDDAAASAEPGRLEVWRTKGTERIETTYADARRRVPGVELLVEIGRRWLRFNGAVLAGHLAYRVFLFLVPLILFGAAILGWIGDDVDVQGEAQSRMGLSQAFASTIKDASTQAKESRFQLTIAATSAILIAGWGLLSAFKLVFAFVWGVPAKTERTLFQTILRFFGCVFGFVLFTALRHAFGISGIVGTIAGSAVAVIANSLLMLGLSWFLPRRPSRLIDLIPGSLLVGAIVTMLNVGGSWYFTSKLERAAELYGTVGIVVVVLGYLLIMGQVIVLGVVTNTVWVDRDDIMVAAAERDAEREAARD